MTPKKRSSPLKKRNPQDSTRRNVQASARRDTALMAHIMKLEKRIAVLEYTQALLRQAVKDSEQRSFAQQQRALGYRHSTSFPASIRVKG